jgi:hypothetical protein
LKLVNVFVIIGYDYRKIVSYEVPNKVGKMTTKVYTEMILPAILEDLKAKSLTFARTLIRHDSKEQRPGQRSTAWVFYLHFLVSQQTSGF